MGGVRGEEIEDARIAREDVHCVDERPLGRGVEQGGVDAGEGAASGVVVADGASVLSEMRMVSDEGDFCAVRAEKGDGVFKESGAVVREQGLVGTHAGAGAAGEDVGVHLHASGYL